MEQGNVETLRAMLRGVTVADVFDDPKWASRGGRGGEAWTNFVAMQKYRLQPGETIDAMSLSKVLDYAFGGGDGRRVSSPSVDEVLSRGFCKLLAERPELNAQGWLGYNLVATGEYGESGFKDELMLCVGEGPLRYESTEAWQG